MEEKKPWGYFKVIFENEACKVKIISVNPGQKISLQSHSKRSEHWTIVKGKATVWIGNNIKEYTYNETVYIEKNTKHRLENKTKEEIQIIEVQCGKYFGEDDIVRYLDDYKRV